ncbi:sterol desaturase family protein [Rhodoferax aquaticus]|uniref:Fatty acid hydroxylase family protein n=1 Tax=Rhodoferax aquaticus TaxID=2527691 RepID=A0A515ERB6_9BURK|nr:sterol desaturase family protein [Rhodoferax aquaticus]QDL55214.1 fatty acid hydroxylase family protein [Rhodoferax aquaticus]
METLVNYFEQAQAWIFETLVQPFMFFAGLGGFLEDGYSASGWFLVGLCQLAVMLLVFGPLQRWKPVEPIIDKAAIRTDIVYTLMHRLGLVRLALFFSLEPLIDSVIGQLRVAGLSTFHFDDLWPGVSDQAWVSLLVYLLVFDFVNYWIHRGQHQWNWWWKLHALHHSQRQMTMWSDNRNHLLDDVIRDGIIAVVALLIGIPPAQFVAVVAFVQLSESFQHANLRVWFGVWGERLWVSPRFHRLHHSVGIGHESNGRQTLGGHNFGVLLPWWDMLFGTANFEVRYDPTGVRDQVEQGVDYGRGFWAQQWLGLRRLWH